MGLKSFGYTCYDIAIICGDDVLRIIQVIGDIKFDRVDNIGIFVKLIYHGESAFGVWAIPRNTVNARAKQAAIFNCQAVQCLAVAVSPAFVVYNFSCFYISINNSVVLPITTISLVSVAYKVVAKDCAISFWVPIPANPVLPNDSRYVWSI